jgi:glycopeptide antibiotics resistance protein
MDDILLNVLGVLCGYGLWRLARRFVPGQMEKFHVRFNEEQR